MKNNYFIPGFEPDEIRDMAKSALKQVHARHVMPVHNEQTNSAALNIHDLELREPYEFKYGQTIDHLNNIHGNVIYTGNESFVEYHVVVDSTQTCTFDAAIRSFDRQLDSADHGENVSIETASSSVKVAQ
ncbi:hypothetical protein [Enterobacter ludwigii]